MATQEIIYRPICSILVDTIQLKSKLQDTQNNDELGDLSDVFNSLDVLIEKCQATILQAGHLTPFERFVFNTMYGKD